MKHVFYGTAAFLIFCLCAGCTELKNLRIENANQKATIAQLAKEGDTCHEALRDNRGQLLQVFQVVPGDEDRLALERMDSRLPLAVLGPDMESVFPGCVREVADQRAIRRGLAVAGAGGTGPRRVLHLNLARKPDRGRYP